jgi:hypothetical protein
MFIPNIPCQIYRRTGLTGFGKPTFTGPLPGMCGVIRLEEMSNKTSVRADSTASRGSAKETVTASRMLFPASLTLNAGDVVKVLGRTLTVQSTWPRHDVSGRFDHWQVDLEIHAGSL